MSLPVSPEILLLVNLFGLIFGAWIIFYYAVRLVNGFGVNVFKIIFVCVVVAWCIFCLIVPTTN